MPANQITIGKNKATGRVEANGGKPTPLKKGESVIFTVEPGTTGVSITFAGDSPFGPGNKSLTYDGKEKLVTVDFDETPEGKDKKKNNYGYECVLMINGKEERGLPGGGGGEIEVVKG